MVVAIPAEVPRARPPMRRGLKRNLRTRKAAPVGEAARAAPYEKGTETNETQAAGFAAESPRARPPMRRGLKLGRPLSARSLPTAARAAPYEKGTETQCRKPLGTRGRFAARAAPYEKGTETTFTGPPATVGTVPRARPPMRRGLKLIPTVRQRVRPRGRARGPL